MMQEKISFNGLTFANPIIASAGTFGYGYDFYHSGFKANKVSAAVDGLGGVITKSITLKERLGNDSPRVCETEAGFINSIGLQNKGIKHFVEHIYGRLAVLNTHVTVSLAGSSIADYQALVEAIASLEKVSMIELNLSCPNVKEQTSTMFACDKKALTTVVSACAKKKQTKSLVVKLSPQVTSMVEMAMLSEQAGADAVNIANTFLGIKINAAALHQQKKLPFLKLMGGYSGVGIKPIVMRQVYEVARAVKIPIIATGGVSKVADVIEYLMAGASLVGVGTANLIEPNNIFRLVKQYRHFLRKHKTSTQKLIGSAYG